MLNLLGVIFITHFFSVAYGQICPGSDEVEPIVLQKYKTAVVFICGFEEIASSAPKGRVQASDFTVYVQLNQHKKATKLFSVGAMENYWLSRNPTQGLILEELMLVQGKYIPIARSSIICLDNKCSRSAKECILKPPLSKTPDVVRQIDKRIRRKFTRLQMPLDQMVELAFAEALANNASAVSFFKEDWTPKLDPKSIDVFITSKQSLQRLQKLGCSISGQSKKR